MVIHQHHQFALCLVDVAILNQKFLIIIIVIIFIITNMIFFKNIFKKIFIVVHLTLPLQVAYIEKHYQIL